MSLFQSLKKEIWQVLKLAGPAFTGQSAFFLLTIVDTIFLGQLGSLELASGALSVSWSVCLISIPAGIGSGLDTLASQAFGAKRFDLIGVWFQIAMIMTLLFCIPAGIVLYFTEPIMVALGQETQVSTLAGRYCIYLIPGLVPYALFTCMTRWLQNQHHLLPTSVVAILCIVLNVPFNYLFIWGVGSWKGWGLEGASIATSLVRILMPIMLLVYIYIKKLHVASSSKIYWKEFTWVNFKEYLSYGVPGMLVTTFEVVGFEFTTILVGLINNSVSLAAHGIGLYNLLTNFLFAYAWGIASGIHLGNLVGEGNVQRSAEVAFFCVIAITGQMAIHSIFFWSLRSEIVKIWNPSPALNRKGQELISMASLCMIFDSIQFLFACLIRAIGKQKIAAILYFVCFYGIHLPLGFVFGVVLKYGVNAFWWSLAGSLIVLSSTLCIALWRVD